MAVFFVSGLIATDAPPAGAHTISNVNLVAQHSGKCLDIMGGFPDERVPTHQWSCVGVPWQQWEIIPFDGTYHFIMNKSTFLCLDVPNGIPSDGLQLWQYGCNNSDAQKFTVPSCAGCWGEMRTKLDPLHPRCVDVRWADQSDGAAIQLWPCNGTPAQKWQAGEAYAWGTAPFLGKWGSGDGIYDTRPWDHHIVECEPVNYQTYQYTVEYPWGNCTDNPNQTNSDNNGGHWSLDYYAPSNTQVKFYALGIGAAGTNISARVRAIAPTCRSDGNGAGGGNTVFIDVYRYGTNQWYGWISFGHLKDIAVSPGQGLSANQLLGKTNLWYGYDQYPGYPGCYEVANENGVHSHIEMWTRYPSRYACFRDWGPKGVQLGYLTRLVDVGRARYSAFRSPCVD